MVRPIQLHVGDHHIQNVPLAIGLFISVFALIALCAKRATKLSKKAAENNMLYDFNSAPWSPLATPKRLLKTASNKAVNFIQGKKSGEESEGGFGFFDKEGFGEGALWQKTILMGDRCRPFEFSGVIYYDNYGNRISELPRSPRSPFLPASSLPSASGDSK
ncbi:hypothetical protein Nepgr_028050 [Nepenthes gracilis]|uniref:Transmembrane protein n=1 Tax=Nepenthes gracilis TaxID=150966 RepID=A0AAD3TCW5_NEPGR|nr:hypothetical protein Nepgr_028050 [Nepenthes gracilis]